MIRISRVGTTRLVLVVGPWAFKFARGPRGRRCNKYEADLFKTVDDRRRAIALPCALVLEWRRAAGYGIGSAADGVRPRKPTR
jgi:hypothetical protein